MHSISTLYVHSYVYASSVTALYLTSILFCTIRPSITLQRKVGYSVRDHATQTKETEMVDLQREIDVLQILVQDAGKLRKDLTFATNMLRASYDQQIKDRSTEL